MAWTEESKKKLIADYLARNPTPENSIEIVKELAEELDESPNGVRMILTQAEVYVKKSAATPSKEKKEGEPTKRVSKETQIAALAAAIEEFGGTVDLEILEKMTGKAAAYFTSVLKSK